MKIDVLGVLVDNLSKDEAIAKIDSFVVSNKSHYVVTPYSEIIIFAQGNKKYKEILNRADLSLPDGIGVILAARILGHKISERITGRKFIYDIAKLASEKKYSLALVGGEDKVATLAANRLSTMFPGLKINLSTDGGYPFDESTIKQINDSNSDILLIAYSPPKQELWLAENYQKLNSKVAIGLGGTFDYLAGKRAIPPNFMHQIGLEWLWRLMTQPWRVKRMWNAVPVFMWKVFKYKMNVRRKS